MMFAKQSEHPVKARHEVFFEAAENSSMYWRSMSMNH